MRTLSSAGLLVLLCTGPSNLCAQTLSLKQSVPHITTSGHASADVVPDEAIISLGVKSENASASIASDEMARTASALVAELKAQSVEPKDIKTTGTQLTVVYDDERDQVGRLTRHSPHGYEAKESFDIRVRDATKAGKLAQAMIQKGANIFTGIRFIYSKEREKQRELQSAAMRDALVEAQSFTDPLGLKLGRVIQIGEDPGSGSGNEADLPSRRSPPAVAGKTVSTMAIPVEPGVETIAASISVTWELERAGN